MRRECVKTLDTVASWSVVFVMNWCYHSLRCQLLLLQDFYLQFGDAGLRQAETVAQRYDILLHVPFAWSVSD